MGVSGVQARLIPEQMSFGIRCVYTVDGAGESIYDLFAGVVDLAKIAWSIAKSLLTGNIISDAKKFWEDLQKIDVSALAKDFQNKWFANDPWDAGFFQGRVLGYVIMEIIMLVLSGGILTALKWTGKFAKIGALIAKLPRVAKVVEAVKGTEAAAKLGRLGHGVVGSARAVGGRARAVLDRVRALVRFRNRSHVFKFQPWGGRLRLMLCSHCTPVINRAQDWLGRLPKSHAARRHFRDFINEAVALEKKIARKGWSEEQIQERVKALAQQLSKIETAVPKLARMPWSLSPTSAIGRANRRLVERSAKFWVSKDAMLNHIVRYAIGISDDPLGKLKRLQQLATYAGRSFNISRPTVLHEATQTILKLIKRGGTVEETLAGGKAKYFIRAASDSDNGLAVITFQGRITTFFETTAKSFAKLR